MGGRKDCFAACLYTCYDLLAPDVVMELAWKHGMMDFAMPFFIQTMKNMNLRINELETRVLPQQQQMQQQPQQQDQQMQQPPQQQDDGFGGGFVSSSSMDQSHFMGTMPANMGGFVAPGSNMNNMQSMNPNMMMNPSMMNPSMMDQSGFGSF